jgi:hypothetical protein
MSNAMPLITRQLLEQRLVMHLNKIESGLSARRKQKVGFAWQLIIGQMYRGRADDITLENFTRVLDDCANSLARLSGSLEN